MLYVESFTDHIVGKVSIISGVDSTLNKNELTQAKSKWFNPNEGFGNWHSVRIGCTKKDVLKNLGVPENSTTDRTWKYSTKCECELPVFFKLYFKKDKLYKIVFSAPAG